MVTASKKKDKPVPPGTHIVTMKSVKQRGDRLDMVLETASGQQVKTSTNPLDVQVGGWHYKSLKIQPVQYIHANNIPYFEGNVIKYVTRWRDKNGIADLEKAKHYIDLLIQLERDKDAAA